MSDMVTLTLAHPLSEQHARQVRAKDVKDYPRPGMKITVPRDEVRALTNAGYVVPEADAGDDKPAADTPVAPVTAKAAAKP